MIFPGVGFLILILLGVDSVSELWLDVHLVWQNVGHCIFKFCACSILVSSSSGTIIICIYF